MLTKHWNSLGKLDRELKKTTTQKELGLQSPVDGIIRKPASHTGINTHALSLTLRHQLDLTCKMAVIRFSNLIQSHFE